MITLTPSNTVPNTYSVNWNSQQSHLLGGLRDLVDVDNNDSLLSDVTLACDGVYIQAHKLVLSLCSSFFRDLFQKNRADKSNTIVILGNVSAQDLRYLMQFMYQGKVDIPSNSVDSFLQSGNVLKIEGLVGNFGNSSADNSEQKTSSSTLPTSQSQSATRTSETNTTGHLPTTKRFSSHVTNSINCDSTVSNSFIAPAPPEKLRLVEPVPSSSSSSHSVPLIELTPVISSGPISLSGVQNQLTASLGVQDKDPLLDDSSQCSNDLIEEGEIDIEYNNMKSEPIEVYSVSYNAEDQTNTLHQEQNAEDAFENSLKTLMEGPSSVAVAGASSGPSTSTGIRSLPAVSRRASTVSGTRVQMPYKVHKRKPYPSRAPAPVYSFFLPVKGSPGVFTCKRCLKCISSKRSTSNMITHMRKTHPEDYENSPLSKNTSMFYRHRYSSLHRLGS